MYLGRAAEQACTCPGSQAVQTCPPGSGGGPVAVMLATAALEEPALEFISFLMVGFKAVLYMLKVIHSAPPATCCSDTLMTLKPPESITSTRAHLEVLCCQLWRCE
jgi:hypothetical protein